MFSPASIQLFPSFTLHPRPRQIQDIMRFITLVLFTFFSIALRAQAEPAAARIFLVGKYSTEGTILRWGYGNVETWMDNFREGVVLYRRQVAPNPAPYEEIGRAQLMADGELEALAASTDNGMLSTLHAMAYQDWENSTYQGEGDDFMTKRDNLNNRYVFYHYAADRDRETSLAAGLGYIDRDREEGATYAYRVMTQGATTAIGIKVIAPNPDQPRPLVHSVEEAEGSITLHLDRALHNRHFSGYFIERSPVENDAWQRLNETPFVQGYDKVALKEAPKDISYQDLTENDLPMRYRVIGLDPFGDESPPSPIVVAQGRDATPPPQPELGADEAEKIHLQKRLRWYQPDGEEVASYHLQRRNKDNSELVIDFAAPGDTVMIDSLDEAGTYYYRLIAQDAAGNLAWSEEYTTIVHDLDRPAAPTGLEAETDTNGVVTLTWDKAVDKDVVGYYVFAADGEGRAFTKLTGTSYPFRQFRDTVSLNLGNQYRYYQVMALDKDFLYSDYSDTLKVVRPDIIPPAPAHVSDFRVEDAGIHLNLRHSNSSDAHRHQLLRRNKGEEDYAVVMEWIYPPFNFTDTTILAGHTYLYGYRGVDPSGNEGAVPSWVQVASKPQPLDAPTLDTLQRNGLTHLSWSIRTDAEGWVLYRKVGGGKEQRIVSLPGHVAAYRDGRTRSGQVIQYRIRYVRADGRRSPLSEPVTIQL